MRTLILFGLVLTLAFAPADARAQKSRKKDEDFVKQSPKAGDPLPDLAVHTPDGKEVKTGGLRGHYAVITFGCLT